MLQIEFRTLVFRADNLYVAPQFFRMRIVQQKREVLRGFIGEPAAAGFFPRQPLVKNVYGVSRTRELFPAHGARRSATDDDNLSHSFVLGELCSRLRLRRDRAFHWAAGRS